MSYQPLHHKYRPQTFADLVGQEAIATTLSNALSNDRIAPAYLFTGPRGTGKTSSARIFAKSLNCLKSDQPTPTPCGECAVCVGITNGSALDVIEIDAASNTGVDNIREIIERAQFAPVQCRYKVYVIDECHMLSAAAFNALLKTLEEPPNQVIFILATTDPQRVLPTIISRCQRFDYRRIPLDSMVNHLQKIAINEEININLEAITIVAQIANGGLRDAESLLDQLSLLAGEITVDRVWDLVGAVPEQDLFNLLKAIRNNDSEKVLSQCRNLMNRGKEPLILLQNLASFYLNLLIAKTAPNRYDLVAVTTPTWEKLCQEAQYWEINQIISGQQNLKSSEVQIKNTTQPRLWLEITLLGLLPSVLVTPQVVVTKTVTSPSANVSQPMVDTPLSSVQIPTKIPDNVIPINRNVEQPPVNNKPAVTKVNEENIWATLLNQAKVLTTKAFLEQQCYLINFQGNFMEIAVKNKNLLKIAQSKISSIEKSLLEITGHTVKVEFKVIESGEKKNNFSVIHDDSPPYQPPRIATPPTDRDNEPINLNNYNPSPAQKYEPIISNTINPTNKIHKNILPQELEVQSNLLEDKEEISFDTENVNERFFKKTVEKFKYFFNGEIINLDDIPLQNQPILSSEESDFLEELDNDL
jgi:DNA polymerase-3 subunit gamma/tau